VKNLKTIGNREWCEFRELKIPAILARVDSGAKTSSIQAKDITLIRHNGEDWVSFVVYPLQRNDLVYIECKAKLVEKRSIKGSFGISEERLIVKTRISLGDETFEIELSLANRNTMEFKMLLGREAISGRYLINPSEKYLQKKYLKKEIKAKYDSHNS
jgi:ribosomal protein S6--L-glutamate ligase